MSIAATIQAYVDASRAERDSSLARGKVARLGLQVPEDVGRRFNADQSALTAARRALDLAADALMAALAESPADGRLVAAVAFVEASLAQRASYQALRRLPVAKKRGEVLDEAALRSRLLNDMSALRRARTALEIACGSPIRREVPGVGGGKHLGSAGSRRARGKGTVKK